MKNQWLIHKITGYPTKLPIFWVCNTDMLNIPSPFSSKFICLTVLTPIYMVIGVKSIFKTVILYSTLNVEILTTSIWEGCNTDIHWHVSVTPSFLNNKTIFSQNCVDLNLTLLSYHMTWLNLIINLMLEQFHNDN